MVAIQHLAFLLRQSVAGEAVLEILVVLFHRAQTAVAVVVAHLSPCQMQQAVAVVEQVVQQCNLLLVQLVE
jgi:glutamine phosphoribosylpyrophosphate amidotransferase